MADIDLRNVDLDEVERNEGGRGLRKILEAALAENRTVTGRLATLEAKEAIEEHGWSLVKPEDLAGVDVDDILAKGEALQAEKLSQQAELARSVFERKGLEGEALEEAVQEFLAPMANQPKGAEGVSDVRDLSRLEGLAPRKPGTIELGSDATNLDFLRAAEAEAQSKR